MKRFVMLCLACAAFPVAACAQGQTTLVPQDGTPPTITVEQPVNPVSTKPGGPVLLSMSVHLGPHVLNMVPQTIIPEFHFMAPGGNAVLLHREMVETSANNYHLNPATAINIDPAVQKKGTDIAGGWTCGTAQYYATVDAYIMDADGTRSNTIRYTVHCNGG
jgi:hypothetical protein